MFMMTPAEMTKARARSGWASKSEGRGSPAAPEERRERARARESRRRGVRLSFAASDPPPSMCSMTSSSIPCIFTYPPSGMAEMTYSVPPRSNPRMRGPRPMEKRSTPIPTDLAAQKCPSSCTRIRTPRRTIKARIVMHRSFRFPRPRGASRPRPPAIPPRCCTRAVPPAPRGRPPRLPPCQKR